MKVLRIYLFSSVYSYALCIECVCGFRYETRRRDRCLILVLYAFFFSLFRCDCCCSDVLCDFRFAQVFAEFSESISKSWRLMLMFVCDCMIVFAMILFIVHSKRFCYTFVSLLAFCVCLRWMIEKMIVSLTHHEFITTPTQHIMRPNGVEHNFM